MAQPASPSELHMLRSSGGRPQAQPVVDGYSVLLSRRQTLAQLAAFGLAGCTRSKPNSLRVSFAPLKYTPLYEALKIEFERLNPGVHLRLEGSPSYDSLLAATLRSAISGNLPSVSHQGIGHFPTLVDRGLVARLEVLQARPQLGSMDDLTELPTGLFALPFAISTPVLMINDDLLRQCNCNPDAIGSNWDDVLSAARSVTKVAGKGGLFFDYTGSNIFSFQALLFSLGGSFMDSERRLLTLDTREALEALELMCAFGTAGHIDMTREQAAQAFTSGNLAIFQAASSSFDSLRRQAAGRFAARMRPFPLLSRVGKLPAGGNAVVMLEQNPHRQELSLAYIDFVRSPAAQRIMAKMTGYVPVNPLIVDERLRLVGSSDEAVALRQVPHLRPWFTFPGPNSIKISDLIRDDLQQVITLRDAPYVALERMVRRTRQLLWAAS